MAGSKRPFSVRYDLFVPPYAPKDGEEEVEHRSRTRYQLVALNEIGDLDVPKSFRDLGAAIRYAQGYKYRPAWIVRLSAPLSKNQRDLLQWGENPKMEAHYVESYLRNLGLTVVWKNSPRHVRVDLLVDKTSSS